jgi:hypothetical protein
VVLGRAVPFSSLALIPALFTMFSIHLFLYGEGERLPEREFLGWVVEGQDWLGACAIAKIILNADLVRGLAFAEVYWREGRKIREVWRAKVKVVVRWRHW